MKQVIAPFASVVLLSAYAASAEDPRHRGMPVTPARETVPPSRAISDLLIISDPPRDSAHPARNRQLVIPSGPVVPALARPAEMNALFLLAAGEGRHPTMILLHGLPGNERNLDLAQAARRAGWNVLTFTYRGAWGSEGSFSFQRAVDDTKAALDFVGRQDIQARYGVDPNRIVLAGHSMGGYIAAHWAAMNRPPPGLTDGPAQPPGDDSMQFAPHLAGLILIDAWDVGADAAALRRGGAKARAEFLAGLDDVGHSLGPITAEDLYNELMSRGEQWQLIPLAPMLTRLPVLTIYATHGGAEPNRAFAEAIARACPKRKTRSCATLQRVELDTDHAFSDHRIALAAAVVKWLTALPPRFQHSE